MSVTLQENNHYNQIAQNFLLFLEYKTSMKHITNKNKKQRMWTKLNQKAESNSI